MAFMDHINRVSHPIRTSWGAVHIWHFDIFQGQRQTNYSFEDGDIDLEETSNYMSS